MFSLHGWCLRRHRWELSVRCVHWNSKACTISSRSSISDYSDLRRHASQILLIRPDTCRKSMMGAAGRFTINAGEGTPFANGSWRLNSVHPTNNESLHRTLDVIITIPEASTIESSDSEHRPTDDSNTNASPIVHIHPDETQAFQFLGPLLKTPQAPRSQIFAKFLLPTKTGYCVRSDFLERRFEGWEHGLCVKTFLAPRQKILAPTFATPESATDVQELLPLTVGAVQVQNEQHLLDLEDELVNRLSFQWISPDPITEKRIAWIKGKEDLERGKRIWEAARALGIKVVILDHEGHWFQKNDDRWKHLREAFIPTNISADEGFVDRIVAAVRGYDKSIDALVTVSNALPIGTAKACEILGFQSAPVESHIIAGDKFKTRELEPDNGQAFKVFSVDDLHARLSSDTDSSLQYSLIVKPCMGWGSECISKVDNADQLIQAVSRASGRHSSGPNPRTDVMIEPYIDGPEVDANLVLIDGEIAFFEVADDFPKPGETAESSLNASFVETAMVLPTALSAKEVQVAKDSLRQTLLRQGFRTGVFHCEGRIQHASKAYDIRDGVLDLYPKDRTSESKEPSFYLHEINARPGGYLVSIATLLTYGVDYYANHILGAIGDLDRARALSVPFANGAQWWLQVVVIQEDKAGVMKTLDAGRRMLDSHADLRSAVVDYKTMKKQGDKLLGPTATELSYLAYFSVVSRESRAECLRLAQKVREQFKYEVE